MSAAIDSVRATLPSISVVICCHNSAGRLPETLLHLAAQQATPDLTWEILIVDNASNDDTVTVAQRFASVHSCLSIRVIEELQLGQTYARVRGVAEARGDVILFVDDDNWLGGNYVTTVAEMMAAHPQMSGLGGASTAVFDGTPPGWITRHQRWFAVSGPPQDADPLVEVGFIWGAGSAFRKRTLEQVAQCGFRVPGRQGTALQAGDDSELCSLIQLCGGRLYYCSLLQFQHYLPARRLTWNYLRRLHHGSGEVSVLLDVYRIDYPGTRWPRWLLRSWYAQVCNAWLQILRHPLLSWRSTRNLLEGDDRVLRIETYRGRLAALKRYRREYKRFVSTPPAPLANCPQ